MVRNPLHSIPLHRPVHSLRMCMCALCTQVREIYVADGGSLLIGSPTCRLYSTIDITFYGSKTDSSLSNTYTGTGLIISN
jgi:hypothetical protein